MANIKQQKKRVLIASRQRMENLRYKSTIKTMFRSLQDAVNLEDRDAAQNAHKELVGILDKAAAKRTLHRNTVARKKSRASRILISEPVKVAKVVRKSKKKAPLRKPKTEGDATKTAAAEKPSAKKAAPAKAAATKAAGTKGKAAKETAAAETAAPDTAAEDAPRETAAGLEEPAVADSGADVAETEAKVEAESQDEKAEDEAAMKASAQPDRKDRPDSPASDTLGE